jgi:hypothetical protein
MGGIVPCKGKSPVETNWELVEFKSELIENVSKIISVISEERGDWREESVRSGKRPEGAMSP